MAAVISHVNLFAHDILALSSFYQQVFGFEEVQAYRSPIFRLLDAGTVNLGFNAFEAYALLDIADLADARGAKFLLNIEVDSTDAVERHANLAVAAGASLVKAPYMTYYHRFQAVLKDPEGNVLRINFSTTP